MWVDKREILFRGKRLIDGKWVEGNVFFSEDGKCEICIGTPIVRITYDVDPSTVCQYTGLIDKNGKKIFECDIVKLRTGRVCKVAYCDTHYFCGFDLIPIYGFDKPCPKSSVYYDLEVIGNIYDKKGEPNGE